MDPSDGMRTSTGLTIQDAEARIDGLESAVVKAIIFLSDAKRLITVDRLGGPLLRSVELLLDSLFAEGVAHSEAVGEQVGLAIRSAAELRKALEKQQAEGDVADISVRYTELVNLLDEVATTTTVASIRAAETSRIALVAAHNAAAAVKAAILKGAVEVADAALSSLQAASDAASLAATAAVEAHKAAVLIIGYRPDSELVGISLKASETTSDATAAATEALTVFNESYEALKRAKAGG